MSDEKIDPLAEGFCHPADNVTEPCLIYMARVLELREFISFYFNFVKTTASLKEYIPQEAASGSDGKALAFLKYNYSDHRPLVNQIMLSRAVESFDLYIITILRDVFLSTPQLLKSEGSIEVSAVIDAGNYENLIWQIVDRKVHDLSYKSLSDLRKFIVGRTGLDLFIDDKIFETSVLASEVRNLIAHNDCIVNDVFLFKTKGVSEKLEVSGTGRVKISDEWLRKVSYMLDGIVFRFDALASKKFGLRTLNRMTSFTLRS